MNPAQTMNLACETMRAGRLGEAETLFREVLAERPSLPDALHLLGCTLCKLNRPEEAVDLIRRAVKLNPGQAVYQSNLGLALLTMGASARRLRRLVRLWPFNRTSPAR